MNDLWPKISVGLPHGLDILHDINGIPTLLSRPGIELVNICGAGFISNKSDFDTTFSKFNDELGNNAFNPTIKIWRDGKFGVCCQKEFQDECSQLFRKGACLLV